MLLQSVQASIGNRLMKGCSIIFIALVCILSAFLPLTASSDLVSSVDLTLDAELRKFKYSQDKGIADSRLGVNYYNDFKIKKTIRGITKRSGIGLAVNDINIIINKDTLFKETDSISLSEGLTVCVKGYFLNRDTLLASSVENIESSKNLDNEVMRLIAALLLLKYKN